MICAEGATEISPGLLVQRKSYPGLIDFIPLGWLNLFYLPGGVG
jgi:hypothetical protein